VTTASDREVSATVPEGIADRPAMAQAIGRLDAVAVLVAVNRPGRRTHQPGATPTERA
jgi:hypothetical protein